MKDFLRYALIIQNKNYRKEDCKNRQGRNTADGIFGSKKQISHNGKQAQKIAYAN